MSPSLTSEAVIAIVGPVVSTLKLDDVTVFAAFPAASLTSAVSVYDCPSVNACKPAALIVTVAESLETVPVYAAPLRVIVTV